MSILAKITLLLGFISAFSAYTFYDLLWANAFYHLSALAFCFYTFTIYLLSSGKWSLLAFVVFLTCLNAFIDELFFEPEKIEVNEYIAFALIIVISLCCKRKWIR